MRNQKKVISESSELTSPPDFAPQEIVRFGAVVEFTLLFAATTSSGNEPVILVRVNRSE